MAVEVLTHTPVILILWILFLLGAIMVMLIITPHSNPIGQFFSALTDMLNIVG